ncbi:MAG: hypothetical protein HC923_02615 [Myxococcales bacterium]|nr:hypothetical protein [Myxococcales bacterium]
MVDTKDVRSVHHLAALVSFGAGAVFPRLAFDVASSFDHAELRAMSVDDKKRRLKAAFEEGLLKIMSKMGIATVRGYLGSKLFFPLGLSRELLDEYFYGFESPVGGLRVEDLGEQILARHVPEDQDSKVELIDTYQLREHRKNERGERHSMTASLAKRVHEIVDEDSSDEWAWSAYEGYLAESQSSHPVSLRHLLRPKTVGRPVDLEDVQAPEEILRRFGSGAMSFGAISAESQRDLIEAMRTIGGRSGSGEGGENPYYFVDGTSASVKQIASGRFGVTAEYLVAGEEIEIKVAQGAKPGEGGQLMGVKVDADIARARHAVPGIDLISPPPLHDIYSIEDLRELIYELKQLKPGVRVSVKLVSGVGIGTIAAGVVKAGADVVQISGGDGGTGAASLSSMKQAGLPWELGLTEVHRELLEQGLREHVVLRVDGGLSTGFDVIAAAALGAEEFGFGKLLLIAEGCIMARVCQKNTCPRGIATQDPKFKRKYKGSAAKVVKLLRLLAEDVRRHLARLGCLRLDQLVGRADLLEPNPAHEPFIRGRRLDVSNLLQPFPHPRGRLSSLLEERTSRLNERLVEEARASARGGPAGCLAPHGSKHGPRRIGDARRRAREVEEHSAA